MARIRTVKPEFFRHEKLQELGPLSMLIFAGLWTQCDKEGRFQWRPRSLKLDILPFIDFDMEKELHKLAEHSFVAKYEAEDEFYGVISSFLEHQRISGKESQEPAKHPAPPAAKSRKVRKLADAKTGSDGEAFGKQLGIDGDQLESQEGKGRGKEEEREKEGKGSSAASPPADPLFQNPDFVSAWTGWVQWRNASKTKLTDHAKNLNLTELKKLAGDDADLAIRIVNKTVERGWKGFFPLKEDSHGKGIGSGIIGNHHAKNSREFPEKLTL